MTVLGRLRGVEQRAVRADDFWAGWARGDDGSGLTDAGVHVDAQSALQVSAVFASVRVLSESVASLPVATFRRQNGLRVPARRPVWLDRPNPSMTRFDLFEQTVASAALTGDAFWYVHSDSEVYTVPSSSVQVSSGPDGRPLFTITAADGSRETHASLADGGNVLHFKAFTMPGRLRGISPVEKAANAVGLAMATEKHGARFFGAGARPSGVIESDQPLDKETAQQVAASWKRAHGGVGKSNLPAVLQGGLKWHPDTLSNEASQFLETRKFTVSEIARLFRVPPHMIGDLDRATFSNIEHQSIEFVVHTLRPWLERIEQTLSVMLPDGEFFKFNVEGLLRGDIASRYEAYATALNNGWMSADEIRGLEDRAPVPDGAGAGFRQQLNIGPAGDAKANADLVGELARMVRTLTDAGFTPESAVAAATSGDLGRLEHTGRPSVQLQQDEG